MEAVFRLKIEKLPEGVYLGTSDGVPGLVAQGRTVEETIEIAKDIARKLYESYIDRSEKPPFRILDSDEFSLDVAIPLGA